MRRLPEPGPVHATLVLGYARFLSGACLVLGLIGLFITGFDYYSNVTGVKFLYFTVNPNTNVIHVIVGLVGIAMCTAAWRARTYLFLCGALGVPWAIVGYIVDDTMADYFGRNPGLVHTHLAASAIALVLAIWPTRSAGTGVPARVSTPELVGSSSRLPEPE